MKVRRGMSDVTSAPAPPGGAIFPVGSLGDQYNTCLAAGGDTTSCGAAITTAFPPQPGTKIAFDSAGEPFIQIAGTPGTAGALPSWAIPAGIGAFFLILLMAVGRR